MSIKYSPQALRDLDRIWDDIVRISASYDTADNYVNKIREALRKKEDQPKPALKSKNGLSLEVRW